MFDMLTHVSNKRNSFMEQTWESLFSEQAEIEEHSQQYISECLAYAGVLHSHNVPVIFDKWHFFHSFLIFKRREWNISCCI